MAERPDKNGKLSEKDRRLKLARRQALLIELAALEEYLGLPRSVIPKHRRREGSE